MAAYGYKPKSKPKAADAYGQRPGGTYNYVVFDDKIIDILKRYAIPFTLGAGGAAMVNGQDMPPELASQMGPQA